MTFETLFRQATKGSSPFPYQVEFATADSWYELVHAPTGSGKTATTILGWLWRYFHSGKPTPRRLVYCLPMRVLVEQTRDEASRWLENLGLQVGVHVLMGGEEIDGWDIDPEQPTILIGTQDMLLSRALNRGYGMSRYRWPIQYALLNNDCLWVLDEIQLMGVGLATSAQLQAFRETFPTFGKATTIWMSATLRPDWLATVDFRERLPQLSKLELNKHDYAADGLRERWTAQKSIDSAKLFTGDADRIAAFLKEKHLPGSLTLVVVNTVNRSRELYAALKKQFQPTKPKGRGKQPKQLADSQVQLPDIKLIHSRFRPAEREGWMPWLKGNPPAEGRILISTQVVEAGIDISARTLITELAPWPSLVQRFGRCNRRGEFTKSDPAQIIWIDVPGEKAAPYAEDELDAARKCLKKLEDAGLKSLHDFYKDLSEKDQKKLFPYDPPHVVRRRDFIDLFDTTPDLAGNDIDIARFIREGEDLDVQVFWRDEAPPHEVLDAKAAREIAPHRRELCTVPATALREFVEKGKKAVFRWDALDGKWTRAGVESIYPGQVFWIPKKEGGYSAETGWDPKAECPDDIDATPTEKAEAKTEEPEYDSDLLSVFEYQWRSIAEHTDEVFAELETLSKSIQFPGIPWSVLSIAARWHDWGKAHDVFQDAIKAETEKDGKRPPERLGKRDIAKAAPAGFWSRYKRPHFRHELASALGVLTLLRNGSTPPDWSTLTLPQQNLALYLMAAHHGKVRLAIRSMPDERKPADPDQLYARGVWDGDGLPAMDLGGGIMSPASTLDLSPMQLGRGKDGSPSWAERMLRLRDDVEIGPLRLAFLEALLRVADMRASKKADEKAKVPHA